MTPQPASETTEPLRRLHLRFGWSQVLVFSLLGMVLEAMHGFKLGWYLNAGQETRRLLLTLAHAHGVLLGIVNVFLASALASFREGETDSWRLVSPLLLSACVLLPSGFLLGGLVTFGDEPGFGIYLVVPGAILLVASIAVVVWSALRRRS